MDEAARNRARKAAESGTIEDYAKVVIDRIRFGEITEERARVAAYLGDHVALSLIDRKNGPLKRVLGRTDFQIVNMLTPDQAAEYKAWVIECLSRFDAMYPRARGQYWRQQVDEFIDSNFARAAEAWKFTISTPGIANHFWEQTNKRLAELLLWGRLR